MKKLKTWQFVLLIIFYPVGIVYFIIWLCKRKQSPDNPTAPRKIVRDINSKIVGVTFGNDDGSSRQTYIKALKPGQELVFRPLQIPNYPNALGVFTLDGKQLGFVNDDLAAELRGKYPTNPMNVTVSQVTGGNDKNFGCNIHIVIYE